MRTPPPGTLRLALILGMVTATGPLAIDMYLPALPMLEVEFAVGAGAVQRTLSAYLLGMMVGQLFYGPISDRFGRKPPLAFGLVAYAIASGGCALATSAESLSVLRVAQALGGASGLVIARAVVRDCFEVRDAARMFSLMILVMGVAPILAPLVGGQILVHGGWRMIFWTLCAFGALALAVAMSVLPETLPARDRVRGGLGASLAGMTGALRNRCFMGYTLTMAMPFAGMFAYISSAPFLFIQYFGVPAGAFGWYFGANALGFVAASQANGYLVRRFGPARILRWAPPVQVAAATVLLAVALSGAGGLLAVIAPLFCVVALLGVIGPNASASALASVERHAGSASSLLGATQALASVVASGIVGHMPGTGAVPMATVVFVCCALGLLARMFVVGDGPGVKS